jgi:hypothetical protein
MPLEAPPAQREPLDTLRQQNSPAGQVAIPIDEPPPQAAPTPHGLPAAPAAAAAPPAQAPAVSDAQLPPARRPMVTQLAGKAMDMAEMFDTVLSSPFPGWRAEAAAPVGPSTGGGLQARQHLSLISPDGGRIAIGSVDWPQNKASLRSHAVVNAVHLQRFGRSLPIMATDYQAFIDRLVLFLKGVNVSVQLDHSIPQGGSVHPPAPMQAGSTARVWVVVLLIALVMVTAAAIVLYLRS